MSKLQKLEGIKIPRCFKPSIFGQVKDASIHHFSDASEYGYGQASYLRLMNMDDHIHCCLLIGKSRVTPTKFVSIPRLELTAATLSIRISLLMKKKQELKYASKVKEYFWTDSEVVLGYINNESKRFKVFVANRVQMIRDHSDPSQWYHVNTKLNPADDASRGLDSKDSDKIKR